MMIKVSLSFLALLLPAVVMAQTTTCPPPAICGAAPPSHNCAYTAPLPDANGCVTGCGSLFCEPLDDCFLGFVCPAPPEHCKYGTPEVDPTTGCATGCGQMECTCPPEPICPVLAAGCSYVAPVYDDNKCFTGCGSVVCVPVCTACPADPCATKKCGVRETCQIIQPRAKVDKNGCSICTRAKCIRNAVRGLRDN